MPFNINQFLQQAVDNIPVGVLVTDAQRQIIYVNQTVCDISGYSMQEMLGCYPKSLFQGADTNQDTVAYIRQQLNAQQIVKVEILNYGKNQQSYWLELTIQPIHDEDKHLIGFIGVQIDISARKQAEQIAIASEQARIKQTNLLRMVIDEIPDFLVVKDANAKFSLCNSAVADFYNTTPDEMIGKDDGDFGVPPEMNAFFRENVLNIMARGETEVVFEQSQDAHTGEVHHFKSIKKPFKDVEGNNHILVIPHDISDIVRAQEKVQESEKRLSYVLDISQEGIWDWDIPTGVVTHNMQWFLILGVMPLSLRGGIESFKKYLHPEDLEQVMTRIQAHLRGENDTYESTHRMIDDNGQVLWVHDRGRVVERDANGQPVRMLGSFMNISKRKKAEDDLLAAKQEAESASKAKSQFLAAMSHEIRTPMNGVIGMTSMLLTTELTHEQKDYIETIRTSGEALLTVINDILDFSKVEAGAMKLETAPFDIQQVAKDTLEIFTPQVSAKELGLRLELSEPFTAFVEGDAGRWRQILTNFVGNAVKFTTTGGITVRLSSRELAERQVEIKAEVIDTGIGISPEELSLLFKPFQQTSSGHGRKFGGTGLGLSISRQFSLLMGGDTGVESRVGEGSNFWFTVVMTKAENQVKKVKSVAVIEQSLVPKHLLLVEDNIVNQKVAQAMIKRLGHKVDAVSNGEEAVKILQIVNYDLVLMDCQMPVMDGYQATQAIRSGEFGHALNPSVPIVALTANVVQEDRDACFAAGMDDFLSKPFDIQALVSILAKWLPEQDA